jgi:hypothetical protein
MCGSSEIPREASMPNPNDETIVSLMQAIPLPSNILLWAIRVITNLISQEVLIV